MKNCVHLAVFLLQDFVEEKENLFFLTVSAKEKADLLLEAVSVSLTVYSLHFMFIRVELW